MTQTFKRVGFFRHGYSVKDVDAFMARAKQVYSEKQKAAAAFTENNDAAEIRNVSFAWKLNGYDAAQVDAALERLESAYMKHKRSEVITVRGEEGWLEKVYREATTLYPRMRLPRGKRFASASGRGYKKSEVDLLVEKIAGYFDGKTPLSVDEVRRTLFSSARGGAAYDEQIVDVYLDRVVEVLTAVE